MGQRNVDITGFFVEGMDSCNDPSQISKNSVVYAINTINRGGIMRTRPGLNELIAPPVTGIQSDALHPQGSCIFRPLNDTWYKVVAHGGLIYQTPFPFTAPFTQIQGLQFYPYAEQILFEPKCIKSQTTNPDGSVTILDNPYPVLIIQDTFTQAGYWDGRNAAHTTKIPIGIPRWNSQRLWIGEGPRVHAGDFADPLGFNEEKLPAFGFFTLVSGEDITCIGETPDQQALFVFSDSSTDTFQSAITDRTVWSSTPNFQHQLFKKIGCTGPKAYIVQYGLSYWMAHKGVIELDIALATYRTKRIRYSDYGVMRSKRKLFKAGLRNVCAGQYENFCFFSWPSGDRWNAHTVVLDLLTFQSNDPEARNVPTVAWAGVWKGIRPVEWVTEVINGEERCFALSRDYGAQMDNTYQIGIWEAFCPNRVDQTLDGNVHRISCAVEFKQLFKTDDMKKLMACEASITDARNGVDFQLFANGRATGFTQVGSKHIDASQFSPDTTVFDEYRRQQRVIRSQEILIASATYVSAQKLKQQFVDRGFGVMVQWQGDAGIDEVRGFLDADPTVNYRGVNEQNETTAHLVDWENNESISNLPPATVYAVPEQSGNIDSFTERWVEPFCNSRS